MPQRSTKATENLVKVFVVFVLLCGADSASAKSWRGIEPLHSTIADVERLLGPPKGDKSGYMWMYEFPEEWAHINFTAGEPCKEGLPYGWKVPKYTVVSIDTYPRTPKKMEEVLTPGKEYQENYAAHTPTIFYVDPDEGLSFTVQDGHVVSIRYIPTSKDDAYSCGDLKFAAPIPPGVKLKRVELATFDRFGDILFEDAEARLDNFVIHLFGLKERAPEWIGYIVVYAGRRSFLGEAQYRANCYKNYLVRKRKIDAGSLFAVDGGFRENFEVQLYIGRSDYYPAVLLPEVSPKEAQIIKRRLKSCKQRVP